MVVEKKPMATRINPEESESRKQTQFSAVTVDEDSQSNKSDDVWTLIQEKF